MISRKSYKIYSVIKEAFDFSSAQNDNNTSITDEIINASKDAFQDLLQELENTNIRNSKSAYSDIIIEYKSINKLIIYDHVYTSELNICKKYGFNEFIFNVKEHTSFTLTVDDDLSGCKFTDHQTGGIYITQEIDWNAVTRDTPLQYTISNVIIKSQRIELYRIKNLIFNNVILNCRSFVFDYGSSNLQGIKKCTAQEVHILKVKYPEDLSFLENKKLYINQATNQVVDTQNIDILKSIGYSYNMFPNITQMTLTSKSGLCTLFQYLKNMGKPINRKKYIIQFSNTWECMIY